MSEIHNKVRRWMDCGYSIQWMADTLGRNPNYIRQIKWQINNRETYDLRLRERYERKKNAILP